MKVLRVLFIIVVILAAIFFVTPFFLPDSFVVVQTVEIEARPQTVFKQVNSYKNWSNWSPFEADPTMVNKYEGPESGVGAKRIWDGEKAGQGSMTILKSDPYTYIQNELVFGSGEGGGIGSWNFEKTEKGVNTIWTIFIQDLKYPFGRWMGLLIEMNMEPIMAQGLNDLKAYAEELPVLTNVKIIDFDGTPAAVIKDSATVDEFPAMFERNYSYLLTYLKKYQVPITGQEFAIYHNWNPKGYTTVSTGIPVAKKRKGNKRIKYIDMPTCKAVFAKHVGGYNTAETHYAIDEYINDNNLKTEDYIWETYAYNEETDTDSTKWVTLIYYPLK